MEEREEEGEKEQKEEEVEERDAEEGEEEVTQQMSAERSCHPLSCCGVFTPARVRQRRVNTQALRTGLLPVGCHVPLPGPDFN